MQLGPKDLKPELVYTRISGYGEPPGSCPCLLGWSKRTRAQQAWLLFEVHWGRGRQPGGVCSAAADRPAPTPAPVDAAGQTGPRAHLPGYASVCEAYGGFRCDAAAPVSPYILHVAGTLPVLVLCIPLRLLGAAAASLVRRPFSCMDLQLPVPCSSERLMAAEKAHSC